MFDRLKDTYDNLAHIALDKKQLKIFLIELLVIAIIYIALVIIGGLIRFYGMLHNQVIIFVYILEFVAVLSLLSAIFTVLIHHNALTPRNIDKSINRFSIYANTVIVLNVISIIACVIYAIKEGFHNDIKEFIFYLLIKVLMVGLTLFFKKITKDVYVEDDKKEDY